MFKSMKESGYHVCSISPRGDLFSPGVTEMSMDAVSTVSSPLTIVRLD